MTIISSSQLPEPDPPATNRAAQADKTNPRPHAMSTIEASRIISDTDHVANIRQAMVTSAATSTVETPTTLRG